MRENENISIDEAFASQLREDEMSYLPEDWAAMELLLDEEDAAPPVVVLPNDEKQTSPLKTKFIMTTLLTTLLVSLSWILNPFATTTETKAIHDLPVETSIEEVSETNIKQGNFNETAIELTSDTEPQAESLKFKDIEFVSPKFITIPSLSDSNVIDTPPFTQVLQKVEKRLIKKVWVEPEYEYVYQPLTPSIEDFWIGIHYTQEWMDSINQHGFNLQFMSGDVLKSSSMSLYGGFDWGYVSRGRSESEDVILNTVNEDYGSTHLTSSTHDFLMRWHLEPFNTRVFIPYLTASAGVRGNFTSQSTRAYIVPDEHDGSTSEVVKSTGGFVYNYGLGARIRVGSVVSIDARYEIIGGQERNQVDLDNSRLALTTFRLEEVNYTPNAHQFKLGVVFNLSERDYEREMIKEGYYREEEQTYYVDPEDKDRIIVPCDCGPCDNSQNDDVKNDNTNPANKTIWEILDDMDNGSSGGGGSGGSGSGGSFPDIKGPVIRH